MNMTTDRKLIQSLVREVIAEVIAGSVTRRSTSESDKPTTLLEASALKPSRDPGKPIVEDVKINSNEDLSNFVGYLLALSKNEATWVAVEKGIWKFNLTQESGGYSVKNSLKTAPPKTTYIEKGVVSEKRIADLSKERVNSITLGKSAILTPLGREKARQSNITIERGNHENG